ncbi:putative leucine-rich repeat domain, L domain-containing protein [Medicago truncatula]|uniref:F-box/LRR protein, putative n=1 Tax=Medicago truncatula TaxID=3880 RepID=G7ZYJ1_MEDTR|nr:F-box/LRR-repeat protein 3 [Medicago truncatula]KEH25247.1 F-box/LRR protein, putative [Medicago truncatula]RHN50348.1 putative leucine-rich repeat domain, L domain-containing protein [Medicago truncatula]
MEARLFLPLLFKRFANLNTLNLKHFLDHRNLDDLLNQLSNFPLKLTSLKLDECYFPTDGLQALSQNITTLTSLSCYCVYFFENSLTDIVDCFPLLTKLIIYFPLVAYDNQTNFVNTIHRLLSKSPCIQHLELCHITSLNDQHVVDFSLFLGNLVSINLCGGYLTETTFFSLVRNCPLLTEIKMENTCIGKETVGHSGVYPQLNSLYLGTNYWLIDEIIIMFTSIFPNLQLLDLTRCSQISEGICQVLKKCCKLKHLNLAFCSKVKLHGMNFAVPELEVLNLSNTSVDDETLSVISKNCCGLLQLQLDNCKNVTEKGVEHVVENCTQLREINLGDIDVSDENRELLLRRGCRIC